MINLAGSEILLDRSPSDKNVYNADDIPILDFASKPQTMEVYYDLNEDEPEARFIRTIVMVGA